MLTAHGVLGFAYGTLGFAYGSWRIAYGVLRFAYGVLRFAYGTPEFAYGIRQFRPSKRKNFIGNYHGCQWDDAVLYARPFILFALQQRPELHGRYA